MDFGCRNTLRCSMGSRSWIYGGTTPEIVPLEARIWGSGKLQRQRTQLWWNGGKLNVYWVYL